MRCEWRSDVTVCFEEGTERLIVPRELNRGPRTDAGPQTTVDVETRMCALHAALRDGDMVKAAAARVRAQWPELAELVTTLGSALRDSEWAFDDFEERGIEFCPLCANQANCLQHHMFEFVDGDRVTCSICGEVKVGEVGYGVDGECPRRHGEGCKMAAALLVLERFAKEGLRG